MNGLFCKFNSLLQDVPIILDLNFTLMLFCTVQCMCLEPCAAPTSILIVGTIFWFYFPSSSLSKVFWDFIVLSLSYSG